jgi:hypothetical protein
MVYRGPTHRNIGVRARAAYGLQATTQDVDREKILCGVVDSKNARASG